MSNEEKASFIIVVATTAGALLLLFLFDWRLGMALVLWRLSRGEAAELTRSRQRANARERHAKDDGLTGQREQDSLSNETRTGS